MTTSDINRTLVQNLIRSQFPEWSDLPIEKIAFEGWDNRTFRLGNHMLIRLPSAEAYAESVHKEQKWLPFLAPELSLEIPEPLGMGHPCDMYPWNWSIYKWIQGKSANLYTFNDEQLEIIAHQLSHFLKELHQIKIDRAPEPGPHNFFRGAHPSVYDKETRRAITNLKSFLDCERMIALWEKSLESRWHQPFVWIHGDLSAANIIIRENRLKAVIDFGGTGVGDPACDLSIAWTFFKNKSREVFKKNMDLDSNTWERARGWVLWKALVILESQVDKTSPEAKRNLKIVDDIVRTSLV